METEKDPVVAVFPAIAAVRAEINAMGVSKDDKASGGGITFNFRGIDRTLNAFSGPMLRANLMMLPSYSELIIEGRKTKTGETFHARVTGSYRLVSTLDGSSIELGNFFGEANDTQDKAIAKAQSIALRQAYLQTFIVPLGPEYDPEAAEDEDAPETPAAKGKAVPRKVEGKVVDKESAHEPISENSKKMLAAKMRGKGVKPDNIATKFGTVHQGNFNEVMKWVNNFVKPEASEPDAE